ncbi:MAG: Ig-like domain-containing protein, partial [Treponemataceae bacterium]
MKNKLQATAMIFLLVGLFFGCDTPYQADDSKIEFEDGIKEKTLELNSKTYQVKVKPIPGELVYRSVNKDVATVDFDTGLVTLHKEGTAIIRVTRPNNSLISYLTDHITIHVVDNYPIKVEDIRFFPQRTMYMY